MPPAECLMAIGSPLSKLPPANEPRCLAPYSGAIWGGF